MFHCSTIQRVSQQAQDTQSPRGNLDAVPDPEALEVARQVRREARDTVAGHHQDRPIPPVLAAGVAERQPGPNDGTRIRQPAGRHLGVLVPIAEGLRSDSGDDNRLGLVFVRDRSQFR